jgi:hypothetical protein
LRVVLPKRTYVLPWAQFLYAEGAPDTVRAVFSMHDVIVTGCGLDALLADVAAQVVTVLQQPLRSENFAPVPGPRIVAVEVRRLFRVRNSRRYAASSTMPSDERLGSESG